MGAGAGAGYDIAGAGVAVGAEYPLDIWLPVLGAEAPEGAGAGPENQLGEYEGPDAIPLDEGDETS